MKGEDFLSKYRYFVDQKANASNPLFCGPASHTLHGPRIIFCFNKSLFFAVVLLVSACSSGGGSGGNASFSGAANVLPVTVESPSGGVCGEGPNTPCTQVTICTPNTNDCQTISNILVDTGSSGLRIFQSLLTTPLPVQTGTNSLPVAECVLFGDGSAAWGPLEYADVYLGREGALNVPIQVILNPDTTVSNTPGFTTAFQNSCISNQGATFPLDTPSNSGLDGILGIGYLKNDLVGYYYLCTDPNCSTGAPISNYSPTNPVQNPVFLLPVNNNGVILTFPPVSSNGASSVTGSLTLGIGTQSNNSLLLSNADIYPIVLGTITTTYSVTSINTDLAGYIDSGTNLLLVPDTTNITACQSGSLFAGFYCSAATRTAENIDVNGNPIQVVFQIADTSSLNSNFNVFNNLGGPLTPSPSLGFDWGFPFFLGRTIYLGYGPAPGTSGPYFAY